jgi:glutaminase
VRALVDDAYSRFRANTEGANADYIPALSAAPRDYFGICVASTRGPIYAVGDTAIEFSIQSVSKPFVFALVCHSIGAQVARELLGVNATGLPFNSIMAIELNGDRTVNPLVNAGAMVTTSLVPGEDLSSKWSFILNGLSQFAGRPLELNQEVYQSETETNQRNHGLAWLLRGYRRLHLVPSETVDLYTRQCAINVTALDLAVMGATLANGGVNPVTGVRVVDDTTTKSVLAVMATAGLYERSGDWLFETGLPGKSGVSGGIVTIAPGKGGLGTFAPPLDATGNSVKGQLVARFLSEQLGLNLFASSPMQDLGNS